MSVVINPVEGKFLKNWIIFGKEAGANNLTVSWDDASSQQASLVLKDEYSKLGGQTDVSGICNLITSGDLTMFPFRAWIEVKLAN